MNIINYSSFRRRLYLIDHLLSKLQKLKKSCFILIIPFRFIIYEINIQIILHKLSSRIQIWSKARLIQMPILNLSSLFIYLLIKFDDFAFNSRTFKFKFIILPGFRLLLLGLICKFELIFMLTRKKFQLIDFFFHWIDNCWGCVAFSWAFQVLLSFFEVWKIYSINAFQIFSLRPFITWMKFFRLLTNHIWS